MSRVWKIDVVEHAAYIASESIKMQKEFPTISLVDIIQELTLLVLQYSDQYDTDEGTVTTFIATFPARKLRQALIYRYVDSSHS